MPTRVGEDALARGLRAFVDPPVAGRREFIVRAVRRHRGRVVVAFEDIESADAARALVGCELALARDDVTLGKNEYLDDDLVGLQLVDEGGEALGTVRSVRHFPAQDCLVVGPREALVPLVAAFILNVDVAGRRIVVRLPAGLLDEALAEEA